MVLIDLSTSLTDVGLAIESALFCGLLVGRRSPGLRYWAIAFGCTAIAALAGALYHGLVLPKWGVMICHATIAHGIGLASSSMVLGIVSRSLPASFYPWCFSAIGVYFVVFSGLKQQHLGDFRYVAADYLVALGIGVGLAIAASIRHPSHFGTWLMAGFSLSGLSACVLMWQWTPIRAIHPEAIYHLFQMVALYCLFQGSRTLTHGHAH